MKSVFVLLFLTGLAGCTPPTPTSDKQVSNSSMAAIDTKGTASSEQTSKCSAAKEAAVAARFIYDKDYRARAGGGGGSGPSLTVGELDACRLVESGAFVGKWKGRRWRFLPVEGSSFTRDPKKIWVSDTVSSEADRVWHSEWRGDFAPDAKTRELTDLLAQSAEVEGK